MYSLAISPELDRKLAKLLKKNKKQYEIIMKKAEEILRNPHHYKNLRVPLGHLKRIHVDKHFVLTFLVDETNKKVVLQDFDHHDLIYKS